MVIRSSLVMILRQVCRSQSNSAGWTLIEIGAVTVIVGILTIMATPSFMAMQARSNTKANLSALKQALQQAQRNAIKMGKECRLRMDTASTPPRLMVETGTQYAGCLPDGSIVLRDATFYENFPGTTIRFSYKGNSTNLGTMVVESSQVTGIRYCLVMSNFIGMMRSGIYEAAPPTISASNCKPAI